MLFEDHVLARVRNGIRTLDPHVAADVYALSFYPWAEDDDARRIRLMVSYNTEARCRACSPSPGHPPKWPIASDAGEARWNFAFWLQAHGEVCDVGADENDAAARAAWIASLKLGWTDEEDANDFEATLPRHDSIFAELEAICVSVAKRLHEDETIVEAFGRPIPIVIHDLEYAARFAALTSEANPRGLALDFLKWTVADG